MDPDHQQFLDFMELLWAPRRVAAVEMMLEAVKGDDSLSQILGTDPTLDEALANLRKALEHKSPNVRHLAAKFVGKVTELLAREGFIPEEVRSVIPALLRSVTDPDGQIRLAALTALRPIAGLCPLPTLVDTLIQFALGGEADVVVVALEILQAVGPDAASVSVTAVAALLSHKDGEVQLAACRTLAWLGDDARPAVADLIKVALRKNNRALRAAAAKVLALIDSNGRQSHPLLKSSTEQETLLALLRNIGPAVRDYRHSLQEAWAEWAAPVNTEPPPDLRRVWHAFTDKERELLQAMWDHRSPEGLPNADLYPLLGWETLTDPDKNLNVHLTNIRRKLQQLHVSAPFDRHSGRIYWPARGAKTR
jgi:hypothetical protein